MDPKFKEYNRILGIEEAGKETSYDYSENDKWYSGNSKDKNEEPREAWEKREYIVADV